MPRKSSAVNVIKDEHNRFVKKKKCSLIINSLWPGCTNICTGHAYVANHKRKTGMNNVFHFRIYKVSEKVALKTEIFGYILRKRKGVNKFVKKCSFEISFGHM